MYKFTCYKLHEAIKVIYKVKVVFINRNTTVTVLLPASAEFFVELNEFYKILNL